MQTAVTPTENQLPIQVNKHLVTFCTVAVFLYALSRFWIGSKISAYFEAAFLLPFYYVVLKNWWFFKKQFLTWLVIAMLVVPILQFLVQYYQDPILAMKYQGVDKLFRLTFFLAAAFWLAHNLKLLSWFIIANVIALLILISIQPNLETFIKYTSKGSRYPLEGINAQFLAVYSGLSILALASVVSQTKYQRQNTVKYMLISLGIITAALFIYTFVVSQTRAALLGLIICSFCLITLIAKHNHINFKYLKQSPKYLIGILVLTIIILAGALQSNVSKRIAIDLDKINFSNHSTLEKIGGGRGEIWMYASKLTLKKPLLGHGGEARKDLIMNATEDISSKSRKGLHHAHNSWLDIGIAYGLIGLLLLSIFIIYFLYLFSKQWNKNEISNHIALFSILSLYFLVIVNQFESNFFFWQGGYLLFWVASPALAFSFGKVIAPHEHNKLEENYAPKNA